MSVLLQEFLKKTDFFIPEDNTSKKPRMREILMCKNANKQGYL